MATLEEILHGDAHLQENRPKGSQQWAEGQNRTEKPVQQVAKTAETQSAEQVEQAPQEGFYEWFHKKSSPYKELTPEEEEKQKRKEKRDKIFAAIGDGISALSNLYFTTQGAPSMYDGKNTMSERAKVRYDKLKKEREQQRAAYYNGLVNARRMDEAVRRDQRDWKRQLQLDAERREREQREDKWRREQADIAQRRYDAEVAYKKERDKAADEFRNRQYNEGIRRANKAQEWAETVHNDNVKLREGANTKRLRGKELAFADGQGNKVVIYENVWKPSMQLLFDVLQQELAPADEKERKSWDRKMKKLDTAQKKEDFVKQNWTKSPRVKEQMLKLSEIDPSTMVSELASGQDDDFSQYEVNGGEEDFSQYEVK